MFLLYWNWSGYWTLAITSLVMTKDWVVMKDIALVEDMATSSMVKEIVLKKERDISMDITECYKHYSKDKKKEKSVGIPVGRGCHDLFDPIK